ncbi:MAG TPA: type II secretion system minor pseudopilin GspI [Nevskiaceae bacterium]|nr:type II secretion system minor pseudopilin GspI [Nevskiaceae bacterium]
MSARRPLAARGFTLVEVLVAVAVLAIAMAAIIQTMARQAANAGYLREKTIALWVAHNQLAEMQLKEDPPDVGKSDGEAEMSGVKWKWKAEVKPAPGEEQLRRIDIEVMSPSQKTGSLAQLSGFVSVPKNEAVE